MRPLKLSQKVYKQYKSTVRGNEDISFEQAELKFLRNMSLSVLSSRPKGKGTYCQYGDLHFIVSEKDVVVWMKNRCPSPKGWKRNNKRYLELNKVLGIEDDITMLGLIARDASIKIRKKYGGIKWKLKNRLIVG